MAEFVVVVDFRLKPGTRPAFRALIDANARNSVANEAGCRRFDVLEPQGEADRILLYEIYASRADFDLHLQSEHYARFNTVSEPLCLAKAVTPCDLVCEGSA